MIPHQLRNQYMDTEAPKQYPTVHAVVLAAGLSSRMSEFKLLAPVAGRPVIQWVVDAIVQSARCSQVAVITGRNAQEVQHALRHWPDIAFVHNKGYEHGDMVSSVKLGAAGSVGNPMLLALGDQPLRSPAIVSAIVSAWVEFGAPVTKPQYEGKSGHPVLFSPDCVDEILELKSGHTLRDIVKAHTDKTRVITWPDPEVITDIDTASSYESVCKRWLSTPPG